MNSVVNAFKEHKGEINDFYCFLEKLISHGARLVEDTSTTPIPIKVETTAIAKSSFILMLYNCIESTVVNSLNAIISAIKEDACRYSELVDPLQMAFLASYDYQLMECESKDERSKLLKKQADLITGVSGIDVDIKSLCGSSSQGNFSGSLDCRVIRHIFERLGINVSSLVCDEMKTIKDQRNKLAHGETSFQETGREFTIQYLKSSMDSVFSYFDSLIQLLDDYLRNKDYRR